MRRFKKTTIRDVAEQAGVSLTTVSLFVKGKEDVCSEATARRIRDVIASLNYTPSSIVSSVHHRLRSTFGVCMYPPLYSHLHYGDSFFERLWRGILNEVDSCGYSTLSYPAAVRDSVSCDAFLDGRVDGVIFFVHSCEDERPTRVVQAGMPVVLLNRSHDVPAGCGSAYSEDGEVVDLALSHLWALGHRRIAHIAGPVETGPSMCPGTFWTDDAALRRLLAYRTWMEQRGVADLALIGYSQDWKADHVPKILDRWFSLPQPPTAIFCANDLIALGVLIEAQRRGFAIPTDLSVVGVDNSIAAREASLPLTTVDVPNDAVGREAIQVMLRLLQGAPLEECRTSVSGAKLIVQQTTGPCTHQ